MCQKIQLNKIILLYPLQTKVKKIYILRLIRLIKLASPKQHSQFSWDGHGERCHSVALCYYRNGIMANSIYSLQCIFAKQPLNCRRNSVFSRLLQLFQFLVFRNLQRKAMGQISMCDLWRQKRMFLVQTCNFGKQINRFML